MKKIYGIIIMSILCLIISACSNNEYKGENRGTVTGESLKLEEKSGKKFEVTDELAIDIGNAVIKSVYGKNAINKTEYDLRYYEKHGVYLFARIPTKIKGKGFGWDYEVAIRKEDGAILGVWMGD